MNRLILRTLTVVAMVVASAALSHAQATRTWVSGVGDDANPCSRTAPCKTFAGAISKTAEFGEISVLDPGGYGAVTITKPITLSGDGTLAGILNASTNGIIINLTATQGPVILRNLSIAGANTAINGIRYLAGPRVLISDCTIAGQTGSAIDVSTSSNGNLTVLRTTMTGGAYGVSLSTSSGRLNATLERVAISGTTLAAIRAATANVFATLSDSVLTQNLGVGVVAESGSGVSVEASTFTGNGTALLANAGGTIRTSDSAYYDNLLAFGCGGNLVSAGNNRKGNNAGGSGSACAPTMSIAVQ